MNIRRFGTAVLFLFVLLVTASPAAAQMAPAYGTVKGMDESFRIDVGGFFQKFDTTVFLESSDGRHMDINLEEMLAQDARKTSLRFEGYWRFGRHARLQFGYLGWSRASSATISQDIQWGDYTYHAGATVDSSIKVKTIDLYYAYSFANTGETEIGSMLGISSYITSTSLSATGTITGPDGTVSQSFTDDNNRLWIPVPATGAYLRYTLLPGFTLEAQVKWLPTISISGYKGGMLEYRAGLNLYFTKNIGIGAAYQYSSIHVSHTETNTIGFEYKYSGPYGYLSLAF